MTLSPILTVMLFTVPAIVAGTSIEALSPSTVMSESSTETESPTLTNISVTSTSSPPMSGTLTSTTWLLFCAGAGAEAGAETSGAGVFDALAPSSSNSIILTPVVTLSPTLTMIDLTIPACGAGISIDALSPSTVNSD